MIQASEAFHAAVRNGAPQRALLRFRGAVFDNEDISVTSAGIKLTEIINGDTNLHFGLCSSAHFEASLINRANELESFDFGEFQASLGVKIASEKYTNDATAVVDIDSATTCKANKEYPYLYINGVEATNQPDFPVYGLAADNGKLYAFGKFGNLFAATSNGGGSAEITQVEAPTISPIMQRKIDRIVREQRGVSINGTIMKDYHNGIVETYEFAPLGTFIAPKPNVLRKAVIQMEAEDRMQLFDSDLSDVELEYPLSMETALDKLCESVGVQRVEQALTNADLSIDKKPDVFEGATKRDLLSWIAEASATFARFNRYGQLELVRFNDTGVEYSEKDYVSLAPYTYKVPAVNKLHIRNANADHEEIVGDGENGYLIQDNPFLRPQATTYNMRRNVAQAVNSASQNILDALSEVGQFKPASADTFADWTVQAGDVVSFRSGDEVYKTPIYSTNLTWKGSPRITMESTGDDKPAQIPLFQRRQYGGGAGLARVEKELDETRTWAEIQVDEQAGLIALLTGSVNDLTGEVSSAVLRLDGLESEILLKADNVRVEAIETEIKGLLKVDQLAAQIASLEVLKNASIQSDLIDSEHIECQSLDVNTQLLIQGETAATQSWVQAQGYLTSLGNLDSISAYSGGFTNLSIYSNGKLSVYGRTARWQTIYFVDEDGVGRDVTVLAQG